MKCNYELTVPEFAWLIRQPKSAMNMYYLHGIHGGSEIVQEIEMRIISETQPDQRLRKLIQRGHLDDAEVSGVAIFDSNVYVKYVNYFNNSDCEEIL